MIVADFVKDFMKNESDEILNIKLNGKRLPREEWDDFIRSISSMFLTFHLKNHIWTCDRRWIVIKFKERI